MNLYDPHRRKTNDTPELLGRRSVVPRLTIFPREDGTTTTISAMIPDDGRGRYSSRQVLRNIEDNQIPTVLSNYRADPEGTLETLFNITLAPVPEPSDFELAHGIKRSFETPRAVKSQRERESQFSDEEILL